MPNLNFLVGFYNVPGVEGTVTVETPLTGIGAKDYASLYAALKKLHPHIKPGQVVRTGSTIETRAEEAPFINPYPGMTLRQVFTETPTADGTGAELFRSVGSVFFDGMVQEVVLRYLPDKGVVGVTLMDRMTRNPTRLSNQINAGFSCEELPKLIGQVLEGNFKDLKVRVQQHPPQIQTPVVAPVKK